ncbi:hypothetical protein CJP74_03675 [Psittacicella melopsittaci]|uniref:Uncharacterized protein n=1 Tax=Psittacicella melopsittaci TaxID=2028576 RepID=A0A3A1Y6G9_9GAMM|nr:hypothetical protein [Psittacicella melopsittaci]RIY32808.1 hypothetical protein CJP74_03675 [Psittacicella melopsittaci]
MKNNIGLAIKLESALYLLTLDLEPLAQDPLVRGHQAYLKLLEGIKLEQVCALEVIDLRAGEQALPDLGKVYTAQVSAIESKQAFVDLISIDKSKVNNPQYWQAVLKLSDCGVKAKNMREILQDKQKIKVQIKSPAYADKLARVYLLTTEAETLTGYNQAKLEKFSQECELIFSNQANTVEEILARPLYQLDSLTYYSSGVLELIQALALNPQKIGTKVSLGTKGKNFANYSRSWKYVFAGLDYTDALGINYLLSLDPATAHLDINSHTSQVKLANLDLSLYQNNAKLKEQITQVKDPNLLLNLAALPQVDKLLKLTKLTGQISIDFLPISKKYQQLFSLALEAIGLGKDAVLQSRHPFKQYLTGANFVEMQIERKELPLAFSLTAPVIQDRDLFLELTQAQDELYQFLTQAKISLYRAQIEVEKLTQALGQTPTSQVLEQLEALYQEFILRYKAQGSKYNFFAGDKVYLDDSSLQRQKIFFANYFLLV